MKKQKLLRDELANLTERIWSAVHGAPCGSGSGDGLGKCSVNDMLSVLKATCSVGVDDDFAPLPKRPSEYFDIALGALRKSDNSPSEEEGMLRLIFEMGK
ncbi:hypothetical protein E3J62_12035, partial [candidate division TA06 bacterium]